MAYASQWRLERVAKVRFEVVLFQIVRRSVGGLVGRMNCTG